MLGAWESQLRIGIGMAMAHEGPPLNAKHLFEMIMPQPHGLVFDKRYGVDMARNAIVEDAIKHDATHIVWLDEDVFPPLDGIMRLLRQAEKGDCIVSGIYYDKKPGTKCIAAWKIDDEGEYCFIEDPKIYEDKVGKDGKPQVVVVEVDAVGFGFCMTPVKLFKELKKPWFWYGLERDTHLPKDSERPKYLMSEDFYICKRAREELGYKVLLDLSVRCEHLTWAFISGKDGSMEIARI